MSNLKLNILRVGTGLFALIALATGAKQIIMGASGALGDEAIKLAGSPALAALDNDLRFLAMCWLVIGGALAIGAAMPRKKPDFILVGLTAVILGGFARLYGFTEFGLLPQEFAPIAIEFIGGIPLLILLLNWQAQRPENQSRPEPRGA